MGVDLGDTFHADANCFSVLAGRRVGPFLRRRGRSGRGSDGASLIARRRNLPNDSIVNF